MFESTPGSGPLAALTSNQLAAAVESNFAALLAAENLNLQLAAAWADVHTVDEDAPYGPLVERASILGGAGTPPVAEFCCAEFGALTGTGMIAAQHLIGDALDARHRLPLLWKRIQHGQIRAWKARKIAAATRHLSWDACADVDHAIHGYTETLPWPRFEKVMAAAIVDADPELAAEREVQARTRRGVWATRSEDGLRTIIAKATTGNVVVFMATLNRIADILVVTDQADGRAPDPVDIRRSRALAILAQPAYALRLLLDHRTGPARPESGAQPAEPDPDKADPEKADPEDPVEAAVDGSGLHLPDSLAGVDRRATAPRVVLHYHLSDASIRAGYGLPRPADHGDGISLDALQKWLAETGCPVTVRPVWYPSDTPAVDRYEIPARMRAALDLRNLADVFPYGSLNRRMDIDHTTPYDRNGPPGQTGLHNLGPLWRRSHRIATHGRWRRRQPAPGIYLWRSPHGWVWIVTNQGTMKLGKNPYTEAAWRAAKQITPGPERPVRTRKSRRRARAQPVHPIEPHRPATTCLTTTRSAGTRSEVRRT